MGIIVPEGYTRLDFKMQLLGKPAPFLVSMGCIPVGPADLATSVNALVTGLQAANGLFGAASFNGYYAFKGCTATTTDGGLPVVLDFSANVTGTAATNAPPPNVALLVRKRTAQGGRRNRGRMFLPPAWLGEANLGANGELDNNVATADLQARLGRFLNDFGNNSLVPLLFHSDGDLPTVVTSLELELKVATQRRRLR